MQLRAQVLLGKIAVIRDVANIQIQVHGDARGFMNTNARKSPP